MGLMDRIKGFLPWQGPTASFGTAVSVRDLFGSSADSVVAPYRENPWYYAGVRAIAKNAAQAQLAIYNQKTEEDVVNAFSAVLAQPNPLMTGSFFIETLVTHYHTTGAFAFMKESAGNAPIRANEIPAELWPLNPDLLTPEVDPDNMLVLGWKYRSPNGDAIPIPAHALVWGRLLDPKDPYYTGMPSWIPSIYNVNNDTLSSRHRTSMVKNGGVPDGFLSTQGRLTPEQVKRLREGWDARHKGPNKAARTAVLEDGMTYQRVQLTPGELLSDEARKHDRDAILATLGVPKFMVTLYEGINLATAKEARKTFWQDTIVPITNYIADVMNAGIVLGPGLKIYFNVSNIEALQQSFGEKLAQAKVLKELGYAMNDVNERLDLGMPDIVEPSVTQGGTKDADTYTEPAHNRVPVYPAPAYTECVTTSDPLDDHLADQVFGKMKRRLFEIRSSVLAGHKASAAFAAGSASMISDLKSLLGKDYDGARLVKLLDYVRDTVESSQGPEEIKGAMNGATRHLRVLAEAQVRSMGAKT